MDYGWAACSAVINIHTQQGGTRYKCGDLPHIMKCKVAIMLKSKVSIIPLVKPWVYADVHDERTCLQFCLICVFSRVVKWNMTEMWQTHAAVVT